MAAYGAGKPAMGRDVLLNYVTILSNYPNKMSFQSKRETTLKKEMGLKTHLVEEREKCGLVLHRSRKSNKVRNKSKNVK